VPLLRASAVLLSTALLAREAHACEPDPCQDTVAVLDLERVGAAEVPTDGVLLLRAEVAGDLDPEDLQTRVTLTVTRDDVEVPGALELAEFPDLLVWRPAGPLTPGGAYDVAAILDNPGAAAGCGDDASPLALSFTAAMTPTAALVPPTLDATASYFDDPLLTLTGVVCCDDAYPYDQTLCGVAYGLTWSRGHCTALETRGYLRVQLDAAPGADPASAGQWARVLLQDGARVTGGPATTFVREIEAPTCFQIDQMNLATGQVAAGVEQCFGDADIDRLGVRPLDPVAALAGQCASDLYTCEIAADAWDETQCESHGVTPAPPADDTPPATRDGCDCRSAPHAAPLALLLLALPRRRLRRARAA
jgi:hypothetical protein